MADVLNPVDVENAIRAAADEVAEGVPIVSARHEAYLAAERAYDQRWAHTYLNATGPVEERKQRCVLECAEERQALDVALVSWKYADRRCKAAEARLSAFQTLSKSVTAMYRAAGTGPY